MARVPRGPALKTATKRHPTFIGFYVGRQDSRFLEDNVEFDRALNSQRISHLFKTYRCGHSSSLWRSEARQWLGYALGALAARA
jgi:enterochelin esterase-like enzyme